VREQNGGLGQVIFQDGQLVFVRHGGTYVRVSPARLTPIDTTNQPPLILAEDFTSSDSKSMRSEYVVHSKPDTSVPSNDDDGISPSSENQERADRVNTAADSVTVESSRPTIR
jgi:hypothetical protein